MNVLDVLRREDFERVADAAWGAGSKQAARIMLDHVWLRHAAEVKRAAATPRGAVDPSERDEQIAGLLEEAIRRAGSPGAKTATIKALNALRAPDHQRGAV